MGYVKIPAATNRTVDFTTSGTWVCPSGVYSAEFLVVGAGGGGGGAYCNLVTYAVGGGGGGGGAVKRVTLATTPGSSYTITVGAKGTGGTSTAGSNGGYSEIVLSGTTLVRSYGGKGGNGINTTPALVQSARGQTAGGGGASTTATATNNDAGTGGGGGAFGATVYPETVYLTGTSTNLGIEGATGKQAPSNNEQMSNIVGGLGIDGFAQGGSGSNWRSGGVANQYEPLYGAGLGGNISNTTGAANGSNATIAGCGGGGACVVLTATTGSTGGNGADGLVRITYFA